MELELRADGAMLDIYRRAKSDAGDNTTRFRRLVFSLFLVSLLIPSGEAAAQRKKKSSSDQSERDFSAGPADYRSKNFLVHTDLPPKQAKELLERLETMLSLISRYWGQRNRKLIECYVVEDLARWPLDRLHPEGVQSIQQQAGVTISLTVTQGNRSETKSVVYAVSDRGTPQHEAVHAYCSQVFGTTGPTWYSEGMAEMGQYWKAKDSSVNCHDIIVKYLRNSEPKSLNAIVNGDQFTGDSWQNYAWRWALCHLLANNSNYSPRFRPLGLAMLTRKQGASFNATYGSMQKEIVFEYLFFLNHFDRGYRVDLCSWDWKTKFRVLRNSRPVSTKIEAGQGWQPSRVMIKEDQDFEYSAIGSWKLSKDGNALSADGDNEGNGKLVGAIMQDLETHYELSEPFELGTYGSFTPPAVGELWLRCKDEWHQLADDSGTINVKVKLKGEGRPLPRPAGSSDDNSPPDEKPDPDDSDS